MQMSLTTASAAVTLAAPADFVWQLIGGFGALPDWLPLIARSTLEQGGRVRRLVAADGAVIVEKLVAFSEEARRYSYTLLQGPLPVADYLATLQVSPAPGGQSCTVTWGSEFFVTDGDARVVAADLEQLYLDGLLALKARLGV